MALILNFPISQTRHRPHRPRLRRFLYNRQHPRVDTIVDHGHDPGSRPRYSGWCKWIWVSLGSWVVWNGGVRELQFLWELPCEANILPPRVAQGGGDSLFLCVVLFPLTSLICRSFRVFDLAIISFAVDICFSDVIDFESHATPMRKHVCRLGWGTCEFNHALTRS
jgi:hypothetical protein